jgi:hypothetical protein
MVLFLAIGMKWRSMRLFAIAGIFCGLATLCRPVALFFPLALLVVLLIKLYYKKALQFCAIFVLGVILAITPWIVRNAIVFKRFIPITDSVFGAPLHVGLQNTGVIDKQAQREVREIVGSLETGNSEEPSETSLAVLKRGLSTILGNPVTYLKLSSLRMFHYWLPRSWSETLFIESDFHDLLEFHRGFEPQKISLLAIKTLLLLIDTIVIILGITGIILTFKERKGMLIASVVVYFAFIYAAVHAIPRYRVPLMPYVIIFAVVCILSIKGSSLKKCLKSWKGK